MSSYKHFTMAEREQSMVLLAQGKSLRAIAQELGRSASTISRELSRNRNKDGSYSASAAERKYHARRKRCGRKAKLLADGEMRQYVESKLQLCWSPDEIAGRAELENKSFSLSYNTIYRAIEKGVIPKNLRSFLRLKRRKNRKKKKEDKRGTVQDPVSFHERPQAAEDRTELGHFESDTVSGARGTGVLGTHVDRKTGYLVAFKIPDKKDNAFIYATAEAMKKLPKAMRKTFTVDHGTEFYDHKLLAELTEMKVYFCDPYSPWQRGSNENTNGLLRQFFPKGASLSDVTDLELQRVVDLINNRPRKRLGYRSPAELLASLLCCT